MKFTSLQRITALYVLFFVVIAIGIFPLAESFKDGWKAGYNDAVKVKRSETQGKSAEIIYEVPVVYQGLSFDIPVYNSGGVEVHARPSAVDLEIVTPEGEEIKGLNGSMFFVIIAGGMYIAVFVIIFIILTSLRGSVKRGGLMKRSVIVRTRAIAILLICASLSFSLSRYLENKAMSGFLAGSGFSISVHFPFDFLQIGTGILIFVIAEIFAIGHKLSEEQRLTI